MKVGKPKSKRVPVRLRHKIEKASAAKQRKQRKEAKKNPQWRSRLKKDPGIPNLFPYKAKVLAEIEENKRKKEEEALRRKEVAKAQRQGKAIAFVEPNGPQPAEIDAEEVDEDLLDDDGDISDDESMDDQDESNPMAALLASAQARATAYPDEAEAEDEEEDEWNGVDDTNPTIESAHLARKGLPKHVIADPMKSVTKLLERIQDASGGIQLLLDYYQIPPLVTAGGDLTSRFLVEVARKRGRLGKGGVPNLYSAALTVLADLNEERLVVPVAQTKASGLREKGEVQVVQQMAEPFRIEGLWGDEDQGESVVVQDMAVEV